MQKTLKRKEVESEVLSLLDDQTLAEIHSSLTRDHETEFNEETGEFVQNEVDWLLTKEAS